MEKTRLSVSNVPKEISVEFAEYGKKHGISQNQLFIEVWSGFKKNCPPFNQKELEIINQATSILDKSLHDFIKKTVLRTAKRIINNKDKSPQEVDKNMRNSYRSADLRAKEIVEEMMEQNDTAPNWYDRKFLSKKAIADYSKIRRATIEGAMAVNMSVIERYLSGHKTEINEHHKKHGLLKDHNLKAYYHSLNVGKK
jgi:hypothetical protein